MSFEIPKALRAETATNSKNQDDVLGSLPETCHVPGYWSSLAKNADDWAPMVTASPLWRAANTELNSWQKEYRREFGSTLFVGPNLGFFVGKSESRIKEKVIEKLTRAKSLEDEVRRLFDQQVAIPRLEDLVRARIAVQFLDGVPFLANKLFELARDLGLSPEIEAKGSLNGYFAQHLTFKSEVFFSFASASSPCNVTCEVQIATALATHVWEHSHPIYETSRVNLEKSEEWQWNPKDPRFLARQLGHMIHLADGLFCNLRDSSEHKK